MNHFLFQEYLLKGCILSCVFFIAFLLISVWGIVFFIKQYKKALQGQCSIPKRILTVFVTAVTIMGIPFAALTFQTAKYGVNMIGEKEADAISVVGKIESIQYLSLAPRYKGEKDIVGKTAEIEIDGIRYYFMSSDGLAPSQVIKFRYLPQSRFVLSYQQADFSEWEPPIKEAPMKRSPQILFIAVFSVIMIAASIITKMQLTDRRLEQIVNADDQKWNQNVVRYHPSHWVEAIIHSIVIAIIGIVIAFLFNQWQIVIMLLFVISGGLSIVWGNYKKWKLVYNENELIIFWATGKSERIPLSRIISINETYENFFWSKGKVYRIVKIQYSTELCGKTILSTIKLDFRYHVGIRQFLDFANNMVIQK